MKRENAMKKLTLLLICILITVLITGCISFSDTNKTNTESEIIGTCKLQDLEYKLKLKKGIATLTVNFNDEDYVFYGTYVKESASAYSLKFENYSESLIKEIPEELKNISVEITNGKLTFASELTFDIRDYIIEKGESSSGSNENTDNSDTGNGESDNNGDNNDDNNDTGNGESNDNNGTPGDNVDTGNSNEDNGESGNEGDLGTEPEECKHERTKIVGFKKATCTEDGSSGDKICADCGNMLEERKLVPRIGHAGGTATCKEKAVCAQCGEKYGNLAEHTKKNEETCTEDSICSVCSEVIVKASGHKFTGKICSECKFVDYYSPYVFESKEERTNLYDDVYKREINGILNYSEGSLIIEYTSTVTECYNLTFREGMVDFTDPVIKDIDSLEAFGFIETDDGYVKKEGDTKYFIKIIGENVGYLEKISVCIEVVESDDVELSENRLGYTYDNENNIVVLNFEKGTFEKAEPTITVTYKFDGKQYSENFYEDGYAVINESFGFGEWYDEYGKEYIAGENLFIGKSVVLYNKGYKITAYKNGKFVTTTCGCEEFSKYILTTDMRENYEFVGWKVNGVVYGENETIFPTSGMFIAVCVYEKTEITPPTVEVNGKKTIIRSEGEIDVITEILIPILNEENGYEIKVLKQASLLSNGMVQYVSGEYGSYEVATDRLTQYKDETYDIEIIDNEFTLKTGGITYSGDVEINENSITFISKASSESGKEYKFIASIDEGGVGFNKTEVEEIADDLTLNATACGKTYYGYDIQTEIMVYTDGEKWYFVESNGKEYVGSYLTVEDGKCTVIINSRTIMEFTVTNDGSLWYTTNGSKLPNGSAIEEKQTGKYMKGFIPSNEELILNNDGTYVYSCGDEREMGMWLYSTIENRYYLYIDKGNQLPIFEYTNDGFSIVS